MKIMRMRFVERLSYAEISRRTGVRAKTIQGMFNGNGTLIDRGQQVTPMYPPNLPSDLEALAEKISKLHEAVCGDTPIRLKVPMSGG